jgi:type VI secretion system protein ImpA
MGVVEKLALSAAVLDTAGATTDEPSMTSLLAPLAENAPCGEAFDGTDAAAELDLWWNRYGTEDLSADTRKLSMHRSTVVSALRRSKELRLLIHFATNALWANGIEAFLACIPVAARWLELHWDDVYPRIEGSDENGDVVYDGTSRKNVLEMFTDSARILRRLRRVPLLCHPQLGTVSLREVELAEGKVSDEGKETALAPAAIEARIAAADLTQVNQALSAVAAAHRSLLAISKMFERKVTDGGAPEFNALLDVLERIADVLKRRQGVDVVDIGKPASRVDGASESNKVAPAIREIRSREDAVRALNQVAAYFRLSEPSSPIPLFLERISSLAGKNFLEIIKDLAPGANPVLKVTSDK